MRATRPSGVGVQAASAPVLVVFDVDGTLVDSAAIDAECYAAAFLDHLGIGSIDTNWANYPEATDVGIARSLYQRHLGRPPTHAELQRLRDLFVSRIVGAVSDDRHAFGEVAGCCQMLTDLRRDTDFSIAIATGGWRESAFIKLRAAGIDIDGLPFASADDATERVGIVLEAMHRADVRFRRAVLVGDGVWDLKTARALGMHFVGVADSLQAAPLREAGADAIVRNYVDYPAFVRLLSAQPKRV